jgi:hypothetical protein
VSMTESLSRHQVATSDVAGLPIAGSLPGSWEVTVTLTVSVSDAENSNLWSLATPEM